MKRKHTFLQLWNGFMAHRSLIAVVSLCACCALFPAVSRAADVSGTSSTYLLSKETADKSKLLPLYEYLDFAMQNTPDSAFSAHFGGWGRYDLQEPSTDSRSHNDMQYGYLSYKQATGNSMINLGRVMVFEGVAAERVDGAYARTDLKGGFGVSAFGGSPVETGTDLPGNNMIYGARVSHGFSDLYKIGVSYLKEEKDSADFRKEEGIDLWIRPMNKVAIVGKSSYNEITKAWMEHNYALSFGPFSKLRLGLDYSDVSYKDLFSAVTTSVFTFSPDLINPDEKMRRMGASAEYAVTDSVNVSADYKKYNYSIAGDATSYSGRVAYLSPEVGAAGVSYRRMNGDTSRLKYNEYRLYGSKRSATRTSASSCSRSLMMKASMD